MISAFTVAHSITLALASLQWVSLPPAVTERAVAVTIILAALAFAFGTRAADSRAALHR